MIHAACLVAKKDLVVHCGRKNTGLLQAILMGLLLIFLFSLSLDIGEVMTPQAAAAVFWMSSAFCQVLLFNGLYAHEESAGQRVALVLAPVPVQAVWLGKMLAGGALLVLAQCIFLPATIIFLGQSLGEHWYYALLAILGANIGAVALGALLGALSQGQSARESLFTIIVFPLLVPLFLAGIRLLQLGFASDRPEDALVWLGIIGAFDAIYLAAGLVLFPFIYTADD